MGTKQSKPSRTDTPTEHPSIQLENIKTKRIFGIIVLIGFVLFILLLMVLIGIDIYKGANFTNRLISHIITYWKTFTLGVSVGFGLHAAIKNIPQIVKYFSNE